MFRRRGAVVEVLLVHPGGPFFRNRDHGSWSIPKGEVQAEEDLLDRARREFEEELGVKPDGQWIDLGWIKQKGGKTVHAWAFEGELKGNVVSNTFVMEWPPGSGRLTEFPEIDRAEFFSIKAAALKINRAQIAFLDRLQESLAAA
jgi:predicted NUDIX family NTP pyrophosphohydrolase